MLPKFSSAGLLYVYISGCVEDGLLHIQQIDSYRDIEDGLYFKILNAAKIADCDSDSAHIFAVVGEKEKADFVYSVIEEGIKLNFQNILSSKKLKRNTTKLDRVGNTFFGCVQEFYCNQLGHFPKHIRLEYNDVVFNGICCSCVDDEEGDSITNAIASLWLERESPSLCGHQLMIKSFFMRDFVDRKVIASLPDSKSGDWRLVFEGGQQLYLNDEVRYIKTTLSSNDIGFFTLSNLQSTLLNPCYAYGKHLQPDDIREEWHKVFLYLCAVSDIEWNNLAIQQVYDAFLKFLEENICLTTEASPVISKEQFCANINVHISQIRGFLRGEDEPVISKDLLQTLNSRYVYLPYLWKIVNPKIFKSTFSSVKLKNLMNQALSENNAYTKGVLWEDVAFYFLNSIDAWKITGRRTKTSSQEIDLSVANVSLDSDLWQLGAYILVECKNWNTHVGIHQIRNIAHISAMKGNKTSILFATNGITKDAQEEIERLSINNIDVLCITANDLNQVNSAEDCKSLILSQWEKLEYYKNFNNELL